MSETSMMSNQYLNGLTPSELALHFKEICPEFGDLDVEEVLLQQESAYQYIQASGKEKGPISDHGQTSNRSELLSEENESQLALDEALARSLELGDDFSELYITNHGSNETERDNSSPQETPPRVVRESPPRVTETQNTRQDDIDPDTMNYEELLSLGEAVGHENKGLSDNLISRLPTFKYKAGIFTKKKKKEDCVICYSEYKNGAKVITLPCTHQYHSECIIHWLKLNKTCPVCQEEVRDE